MAVTALDGGDELPAALGVEPLGPDAPAVLQLDEHQGVQVAQVQPAAASADVHLTETSIIEAGSVPARGSRPRPRFRGRAVARVDSTGSRGRRPERSEACP